MFEQVWRDLDRHYSFFVSKGIDWDLLHEVYVVPAGQAATDQALADAIGAMLAELRDVHVDLLTPGRTYRYTGYDSLAAFFDPQLVHAQYVTDLRTNRRLQFGHAASDVGYVWIPSFGGSGFGADLDVALAQLAGVRALIVDVRNNGGGNNQNGLEIAAASPTGRGPTGRCGTGLARDMTISHHPSRSRCRPAAVGGSAGR